MKYIHVTFQHSKKCYVKPGRIPFILTLCFLLAVLNLGNGTIYANNPEQYTVGDNVMATLSNGVLTLSGQGPTKDYEEATAPFLQNAQNIHSLVIEEGITYIGSYLFYGLQNLKGTLILPASINGFGSFAFYGKSFDLAPKFSVIKNAYVKETNDTTGFGQQIQQPETLFFPGQSGSVIASDLNTTFVTAAQQAGYQNAQNMAAVTLDDTVKLNLPVTDGGITLPTYTKQFNCAYQKQAICNMTFLGWSDRQGQSNEVYQAGQIYNLQGRSVVNLYAVFADKTPLTELPHTRSLHRITDIHTIYVDSSGGTDINDGSYDAPVKSLKQAFSMLPDRASGGTIDTNEIVFKSDYSLESNTILMQNYQPVPATLKGESNSIRLVGAPTSDAGQSNTILLSENLAFDDIVLYQIGHIYGNGKDVKLGYHVTTEGSLYLYGGAADRIGDKVGKIEAYSGRIIRIMGYIRSNSYVDAENKEAQITIGGTAVVETVVAGSASGSVVNANVKIDILGGTILTLVGGCQGYQKALSKYTGTTKINISGGVVQTLYGAGTGRNSSIPMYLGKLDIDISGGKVGDIYGSGSAAFITSDATAISEIHIGASGGIIKNIYAAGQGGYDAVSADNVTNGTPSSKFGSLTGKAEIEISGSAVVEGSIYASGEGYIDTSKYDTTKNAYLDGDVTIRVLGGTVQNDIFGGGKGISDPAYQDCAQVSADSNVLIEVSGGVIAGNVYGGGENAEVHGRTAVVVSGGMVQKNVYGGGKEGVVKQQTDVHIQNGVVNGSVYGGALGEVGAYSSHGGSTVNMSGGLVRGDLYGGSQFSNDGQVDDDSLPDLVFINLTGGTVKGRIFGGSFQGTVNGSTHVHVGLAALAKCKYYSAHTDEIPALDTADILVGSSIYAGGDYGGDSTNNYDTITVNGFSHVYIDGNGYDFSKDAAGDTIRIGGGVFGSGASCDAGKYRLVTFDHYGAAISDDKNEITDANGTLTSIQRADQVRLIQSHLRLSGQSDVANVNQTVLYALNRIGDLGNKSELAELGNSLVLQDGSTLVLDAPSIELANLKSVDAAGTAVSFDQLSMVKNTIYVTTGTILKIACTNASNVQEYGAISGYAYVKAGDTAKAFAYARVKTTDLHENDGGFVAVNKVDQELDYTNIGVNYRYWEISGKNASSAVRDMLLTAQKKTSDVPSDGFSLVEGILEFPPLKENSVYKIADVTIPNALHLSEAAKFNADGWKLAGSDIDLEVEKNKISADPLKTFGLYMSTDLQGNVVSHTNSSVDAGNSIIGKTFLDVNSASGDVSQVRFALTYKNDDITISQNLGKVNVEIIRYEDGDPKETIQMNIEIVTKATALSEQTIDLYATQTGSYTGRMIIPSGTNRTLSLTGVEKGSTSLVAYGSTLKNDQVSVRMKPVDSLGWHTTDLMDTAFDLSSYQTPILIGSTDSRYEAPIDFTIYNTKNFASKANHDEIKLTLSDTSDNPVIITLRIHWQPSIVSDIRLAAGKQYNDFNHSQNVVISPKSAVTASFVLNDSIPTDELWLELQKEDGSLVSLPANTNLTLITDSGYYMYHVNGSETNSKILFSAFKKMWSTDALSGTINKQTITLLTDFTGVNSMEADTYSLRLRTNNSADSMGAFFTVDNSSVVSSLSVETISTRTYAVDLNVLPQTDTRFQNGMGVAFSLNSGETFPDGIKFIYDGADYTPTNGKVYITLNDISHQKITVDASSVPDWKAGEHTLKASVFATGINSGSGIFASEGSFEIALEPSYSLQITASANKQIAQPGMDLDLNADYQILNLSGTASIQLQVMKKTAAGYVSSNPWTITQNTGLSAGEGTRQLRIHVPADTGKGTYRLVFQLGEQRVNMNFIVQSE